MAKKTRMIATTFFSLIAIPFFSVGQSKLPVLMTLQLPAANFPMQVVNMNIINTGLIIALSLSLLIVPTFLEGPENQNVLSGKNASFHCRTQSCRRTYWLINKEPFEEYIPIFPPYIFIRRENNLTVIIPAEVDRNNTSIECICNFDRQFWRRTAYLLVVSCLGTRLYPTMYDDNNYDCIMQLFLLLLHKLDKLKFMQTWMETGLQELYLR